MKRLSLLIVNTVLFLSCLQAQDNKVRVALYDGIVIGGYVDNGGYLNFLGPNIHVKHNDSKFFLSMLPSLRFKEDKGTPKNAFVTPTLGFGFTYSYKMLAVQIPLYYNSKTESTNGKWHVGVGVGLNLTRIGKNDHHR